MLNEGGNILYVHLYRRYVNPKGSRFSEFMTVFTYLDDVSREDVLYIVEEAKGYNHC